MSLKKRDSDTESGEEKETQFQLYESEQDKLYIESLPELERERIIAERYEQFKIRKERKRMTELTQERTVQPMNTLEDSDDEKVYRKKRKKRDELYEPEKTKKKQHTESIMYDHKKEAAGVRLEDIEKIRLSREMLMKWVPHLYFEKTVKGCFVRINIGRNKNTGQNIYLMCEVVDVSTSEKAYQLEKLKTNKMLVLQHGKTKKTMKMDIASNTPFTQEEFESYMQRLTKDGIKPVTFHHIETKIQDIQTAMNYKYTAEEREQLIQMQLEESLEKGRLDASALLELDKLKVKLKELQSNSDTYKSEEYHEKRKKLESLIWRIENAIKLDESVVESSITHKINERAKERQLEMDALKAQKKKEPEPETEYFEEPKEILSTYQQIIKSKEDLLSMHFKELEIDQLVPQTGPIRVPAKQFPSLVTPHPGQKLFEPQLSKPVISFAEWKDLRET